MGEAVERAWVPAGSPVSCPASRAGNSQGGLHRPSCPLLDLLGLDERGRGRETGTGFPLKPSLQACAVPMCLFLVCPYKCSECEHMHPLPSPLSLSVCLSVFLLRAFGQHGIVNLAC